MKDKQKFRSIQLLQTKNIVRVFILLQLLLSSSAWNATPVTGSQRRAARLTGATLSAEYIDIAIDLSVKSKYTIEKGGSAFHAVFYDSVFTATIGVTNYGKVEASDIQIKFTLPKEATVLDHSLSPVYEDANSLYWSLALPAESDTTVVLSLSGRLDSQGARTFFVEAAAQGDAQASNNSDSLAVWFLDPLLNNSASNDLSVQYQVLVDTSIVIDGAAQNAVTLGKPFAHYISISNSGPGTAHDIKVVNQSVDRLTEGQFSITPDRVLNDSLFWHIDSLAAGDVWSVSFIESTGEYISDENPVLFFQTFVSAENDPNVENNTAENYIYILKNDRYSSDVVVAFSVRSDSIETEGGDSLFVVEQGKTYPVSISLSNASKNRTKNVKVDFKSIDYGAIVGATPSPDIFTADSIEWRLNGIDPFVSLKMQVEISPPFNIPEGRQILNFALSVKGDNEAHLMLPDNNRAIQFVCYALPPEPFKPKMEASPLVATVTDSIWLRVQFPVSINNWDLIVHLPNGEIIDDFGDSFIERTSPEPNVWYDIDEPFVYPTLRSGSGSDNVVFETRATSLSGATGSVSLTANIKSAFALLPPNVVSPESDDIPIEFVTPAGHVEIKLYDVSGRFIANLVNSSFAAGKHTFLWNGMTEGGQFVGSGVYLVTMQTETDNTWKKMIIVR